MYKDLGDEIWESLLKAAVVENSQNELKDYPSEQEINRIVLPKHYELRMRRILKHSSYRKNIKLSLRYGKKITSIILVVMGIRFILLLSFDEVCAACQKVIIEIMIGISSVFIPRTLLWITFPLVLGMFQQDTPWWRLRSYASGAC